MLRSREVFEENGIQLRPTLHRLSRPGATGSRPMRIEYPDAESARHAGAAQGSRAAVWCGCVRLSPSTRSADEDLEREKRRKTSRCISCASSFDAGMRLEASGGRAARDPAVDHPS